MSAHRWDKTDTGAYRIQPDGGRVRSHRRRRPVGSAVGYLAPAGELPVLEGQQVAPKLAPGRVPPRFVEHYGEDLVDAVNAPDRVKIHSDARDFIDELDDHFWAGGTADGYDNGGQLPSGRTSPAAGTSDPVYAGPVRVVLPGMAAAMLIGLAGVLVFDATIVAFVAVELLRLMGHW